MPELETCLRGGFQGPSFANRLTVGIPMAVFTAVGLQFNIVLWRIITIQKDVIESNFRRHVISLIGANVGGYHIFVKKFTTITGFNLTAIFSLLPITFFGLSYPDWMLIATSTPDSFFYLVHLYTNFTVTLDRFLLFAAPSVYEHLNGRNHFALVLLPWLVAGWVIGHSTFLGCYKRFNAYQLRFQFDCADCPFYPSFNSYVSLYLPVAIFALYFVIFFLIFRKKITMGSKLSLKNRDFAIVLQFLIMFLIQLAGNLFFYLNFSSDVILESVIRLSASCWTSYSNPIVMFVFNNRIRRSYLAWGRKLWIFKRHLLDNCNTGSVRAISTTV
uniref:G protein-coupled receptor n=1 Tax=Pristionchus pacificus TaxID=54126 RepID=A0A8R1UXS1_PRIPA